MVRRFRKKSILNKPPIKVGQRPWLILLKKTIKRPEPSLKRLARAKARLIFLGLTIIGTISAGWLIFIIKTLPDPADFSSRSINQSTKIWDQTGTVLLYDIHGLEKRTVVPLAEIPEAVKKTTLMAEDSGFYEHPAFDIRAIARALIHNLTKPWENLQGGSTITQQLVKNSFLNPDRTIARKIKELLLAIRFEQKYSKDQILEFYLNQIPYGSNVYGIEAASQTFFNKPSRKLSLAESAILAAMIKRPSYLSPYGTHTNELKARQEYILGRLKQAQWITPADYEQAIQEQIKFSQQRTTIKAPHFVMYIKSILEEMFDEQYIETGGLQVITSLDAEMQEIAEQAVKDGASRNDTNWQADNAALVAQNPTTGQIVAMVGSRDYFNAEKNGNVNVALQVRQPGSSFKPFVYLRAFQEGYAPDTILFDVFTEFNARCKPDGTPGPEINPDDCYHPQNYDEKFRGPVSLRQALQQSLNVPSVKLLYLVGIKDAIDLARSFGITTLSQDPNRYGLSLVLGGGGVKLLEMVSAYGIFSQEGVYHSPIAILAIKDNQGKTIFETEPKEQKVFEPALIRVLNNILSDDQSRSPVFSLGGPLTIPGYAVAAKTGTSQDYRDAWTIGFSPTLVAGVWVGNNDYSPMQRGGAGGMAAAPIWNDFMKQALLLRENRVFTSPEISAPEKPILRGDYLVPDSTGPQIHSILHWVDKDNPLGPYPANPWLDPQYHSWEYGVSQWLSSLTGLPLASPMPARPSLTIKEPVESFIIKVNTALQITVNAQSAVALREVSFFFNGSAVYTFPGTPENIYSIFFVPGTVLEKNAIFVRAIDQQGNRLETSKEFPGQPL